ncbi:hypothetical protein H6M51_19225 [Rhizobium sp. AQ_MP]|uniref:DUF6904 family protein n=1 Tax=Rhizobium sp. AQ_MP TaxID=2761536 RepID=UPI001639945E|nr:hypothetical protein [Rhizobium sp. AQ_MP]MBC2774995.1 hypothetical protein [Rhizobium sp. AQ_MP]
MLSYSLLKNHAGILLVGDHTSLTWLHEVVHEVNDRSPVIIDKEGSFLGLAYDVRKALERQREIIEPPQHLKKSVFDTVSRSSGQFFCCSRGC